MIAALADTHAVFWYLAAAPSLSATAHTFIEDIIVRGDQIGVSTITLIESTYLVEKGRLSHHAFNQLLEALAQSDSFLLEIPVDGAVARALGQVPRSQIPDLPDRIIAATAALLDVPIISRDRRIVSSELKTIW